MPALLFDRVSLLSDGLRLPSGGDRSFHDLGLGEHETLRLFAGELVLVGAPRRAMDIAADRLVVDGAGAVVTRPDAPGTQVRIVAQHIEGHLRVNGGYQRLHTCASSNGSVIVWYSTAVPAPTVEKPGSGIEVTEVWDPQELWTRWQVSQAHAVSNVTAVGMDLL